MRTLILPSNIQHRQELLHFVDKENKLGEDGPWYMVWVCIIEIQGRQVQHTFPYPTDVLLVSRAKQKQTKHKAKAQNTNYALRSSFHVVQRGDFRTCGSRYDSFWVEVSQEEAVYESWFSETRFTLKQKGSWRHDVVCVTQSNLLSVSVRPGPGLSASQTSVSASHVATVSMAQPSRSHWGGNRGSKASSLCAQSAVQSKASIGIQVCEAPGSVKVINTMWPLPKYVEWTWGGFFFWKKECTVDFQVWAPLTLKLITFQRTEHTHTSTTPSFPSCGRARRTDGQLTLAHNQSAISPVTPRQEQAPCPLPASLTAPHPTAGNHRTSGNFLLTLLSVTRPIRAAHSHSSI